MSYINKPIEYDIDNESLGVIFDLEGGGESSYDVISEFEEFDDRYVFNNGREYIVYKKDIVGSPRFYELGIECRQCEGYTPYSKKVNCKGVHHKGKGKEFATDRDFCSESCRDNYIIEEDNHFTPL